MKALIETENNNRIAQIEPDNFIFPVASSLSWIDCPDGCMTDWTYNGSQFLPPTIPTPPPEEHQKRYCDLAQSMMDEKARERNYDNIASACSYTASSNPKFAAEAASCVAWRDAVWTKCYQFLDQVLSDEIEIPSESDFLAMLPAMTWPDEEGKNAV